MYSELLHQRIVALLKAANTIAGDQIYSPEDWPLTGANLPAVQIGIGRDRKESRGRIQPPSFVTTTIIYADFSVEEADQARALARVQLLAGQIQAAILSDNTLITMIQQFSSVETSEPVVTAEARRHVGSARIDFAMEYPEDFAPPDPGPFDGLNIHADLGSVFDQTGTYPNPVFPDGVQPAPRTSGPDGRDEGILDITLT